MSNLKLETYVVGMVQTNCYIVANEQTGECLIIDPGASGEKLAEKIRSAGYRAVAILLTHGHFDHVGAARTLARIFDIPIYAHEAEKSTLKYPEKNVSWMVGVQESYDADLFLKDNEELQLAGFTIRVLHTPGHTEGGCCYYLPEEKVLFSGDTLFAQSVGRTDLPGGSMSQIVRSVREKLLPLTAKSADTERAAARDDHAADDNAGAYINRNRDITDVFDVVVYPGHNEPTTIETERKHNPYL